MPGNAVSATFADLTRRHRAELQAHCYRMLGSTDLAGEHVQEVFQRAWRTRDDFADRHGSRAWLYRIATRACLDTLSGDGPPPRQPYPDALLDAPAERTTLALPFVQALRRLPPRQRAVYLLRDVLAFSPPVAAALLDVTVTASTSALQRARATIRGTLPDPLKDIAEPAVVLQFARAYEAADPGELPALLHEDATLTIEPGSGTVEGRQSVAEALLRDLGTPGRRRLLPTAANAHPAVALYTAAPGAPALRPAAIIVLTVTSGQVSALNAFTDPALFRTFAVPAVLPA